MKDTITRRTIHTLQEFYDLMERTAAIRRKAVVAVLAGDQARQWHVASLRVALECLNSIPGPESGKPFERLLALDEKHEILVDLDYEITELARDVTFLELGENVLLVLLEDRSPGLLDQARRAALDLDETHFRCLITDRDGHAPCDQAAMSGHQGRVRHPENGTCAGREGPLPRRPDRAGTGRAGPGLEYPG